MGSPSCDGNRSLATYTGTETFNASDGLWISADRTVMVDYVCVAGTWRLFDVQQWGTTQGFSGEDFSYVYSTWDASYGYSVDTLNRDVWTETGNVQTDQTMAEDSDFRVSSSTTRQAVSSSCTNPPLPRFCNTRNLYDGALTSYLDSAAEAIYTFKKNTERGRLRTCLAEYDELAGDDAWERGWMQQYGTIASTEYRSFLLPCDSLVMGDSYCRQMENDAHITKQYAEGACTGSF
jgi:hypothetical protein